MQPITEPMQLFRHQRAVRAWADRPVEDDVVRQVLAAAGAAPAARETMAEAPVLIVPCVRVPGRTGRAGFQTGASIYPACQNLMLAARLLGLGSALTTRHRFRREQIHAILGIPDDWESAAIIPLGWPDRAYGPNHRPAVENCVSYDRF